MTTTLFWTTSSNAPLKQDRFYICTLYGNLDFFFFSAFPEKLLVWRYFRRNGFCNQVSKETYRTVYRPSKSQFFSNTIPFYTKCQHLTKRDILRLYTVCQVPKNEGFKSLSTYPLTETTGKGKETTEKSTSQTTRGPMCPYEYKEI